ncbi:hypothetical protein VULLAG_LOCUS20967 [Vulpes lagopus]
MCSGGQGSCRGGGDLLQGGECAAGDRDRAGGSVQRGRRRSIPWAAPSAGKGRPAGRTQGVRTRASRRHDAGTPRPQAARDLSGWPGGSRGYWARGGHRVCSYGDPQPHPPRRRQDPPGLAPESSHTRTEPGRNPGRKRFGSVGDRGVPQFANLTASCLRTDPRAHRPTATSSRSLER